MLRVEPDGPILRVTLDRPDVRNAFNDELIQALHDAFDEAAGYRAVVVKGEGKSFCAGGDLNWMRKAAEYTKEQNAADALKLGRLFEKIVDCPAVVIGLVHGAAFGGGCGVVCACDVAIARPGTLFSFSEARLGLVPATISPIVLPKIGGGHARALFSTARPFDADYALRIGLIHEVSDDLDDAAEAWVKSVLASGPQAVAASKRLASHDSKSMEDAAKLLAEARAGEEGREGVDAFLNKRKANFVIDR